MKQPPSQFRKYFTVVTYFPNNISPIGNCIQANMQHFQYYVQAYFATLPQYACKILMKYATGLLYNLQLTK